MGHGIENIHVCIRKKMSKRRFPINVRPTRPNIRKNSCARPVCGSLRAFIRDGAAYRRIHTHTKSGRRRKWYIIERGNTSVRNIPVWYLPNGARRGKYGPHGAGGRVATETYPRSLKNEHESSFAHRNYWFRDLPRIRKTFVTRWARPPIRPPPRAFGSILTISALDFCHLKS